MSLKSALTKDIVSWKVVAIVIFGIYASYYIFHYFSIEGKCEREVNEKMKVLEQVVGRPTNKTSQVGREVLMKNEVRKCVSDAGTSN
jgi:hypothetical protein